jgi:selenocysteine-specific elongation factor
MGVIIKKRPDILHAIVGTAGHVDHGKTSLVKLLTGCDTDRLPEEKARGMSIDLGFAPCVVHDPAGHGETGRLVGIVDVPGHRDFIRNMVAGAASIDVLLLVIAADDGIMPQTDEHMAIVRLLRRAEVLVALTKIDMVSAERLAEAQREVEAFLARVGLAGVPVIPVSNRTGEGISEVRAAIGALVATVQDRERREGVAFRMNVERVFSVQGYGTVVTGIPVSGQVRVGERVELLPRSAGGQQELVTVRAVQMYKQEAVAAMAGCCCAINLRELGAEQVARGMTIAAPGVFRPATELIATLEAVGGGVALRRGRLEGRLHTGTAAVEVLVRVLGETRPEGGAEQTLQGHLLLKEPLVAAPGDRYILRTLSPGETVGGGMILSTQAQRVRRRPEVLSRLGAAAEFAMGGDFFAASLLAAPAAMIPAAEAARLTQRTGEAAREAVAAAVERGIIADLGSGEYLVRGRIDEVAQRLHKGLERFHRENPAAPGMLPAQVCELAGIGARSFDGLAPLLVSHGSMALRHGRLAMATFTPAISERLAAVRQRVLQAIARAGVNAPARGNLIKELGIAEADLKAVEKSLVAEGAVCVLDGNLMACSVYQASRATMLSLFAGREVLPMPVFRDAVGANRKMAVAMLDAFDAEGLTRRVGDGRVLVRHKA